MKKIILLLCLLPSLCFGQSAEHKLIELFFKANTPISKEFIDFGFLDKDHVKLDLLLVTDLNTDKLYGGLRLTMEMHDKSYMNVLDKTDVKALSKLVKKLSKDTIIKQHNYVEITSFNNVQFKVSDQNQLHIWTYQLIIDKFNPLGTFNFDKKGLLEFDQRLDAAIVALEKYE